MWIFIPNSFLKNEYPFICYFSTSTSFTIINFSFSWDCNEYYSLAMWMRNLLLLIGIVLFTIHNEMRRSSFMLIHDSWRYYANELLAHVTNRNGLSSKCFYNPFHSIFESRVQIQMKRKHSSQRFVVVVPDPFWRSLHLFGLGWMSNVFFVTGGSVWAYHSGSDLSRGRVWSRGSDKEQSFSGIHWASPSLVNCSPMPTNVRGDVLSMAQYLKSSSCDFQSG
jgi:hypothetical protein